MIRSLLYVPGNVEKMIVKARDTAADALILDLEDAVAAEQKPDARALVAQMLREIDFGEKEIFVRVNPLATEWGLEDARAAVAAGATGFVIPKAENPDDVLTVSAIMQSRPRERQGKIFCLVETPRGVFASLALASVGDVVAGLMFGAADLARGLGSTLSEDEHEVFVARSQVLLAARAAGVTAYDTPHFAIADLDGLRRRCQAVRNLGYDGKTVIHPSHLAIVNEVFAPTADQIAAAERVIFALAEAQAAGRGVASLDGKMIDQVHLAAARKVLKQASGGS